MCTNGSMKTKTKKTVIIKNMIFTPIGKGSSERVWHKIDTKGGHSTKEEKQQRITTTTTKPINKTRVYQ